MITKGNDQLERQSLFLIAGALVGHVGNYAYHFITGRMLSEAEYGLLIALFAAVNVILLPMSAFQVSLSRAVASCSQSGKIEAIPHLLRTWFFRCSFLALGSLIIAWIASPWLQSFFEVSRVAPILIAASIPGFNLLLTVTGAGLQGVQEFKGLAFRGSLLFLIRAVLVGLCLGVGFAAAGWALLAHVIGMTSALVCSVWFLKKHLSPPTEKPEHVPVLKGSLAAFPVLLGFSALMTADVILVRAIHPEILSGEFAQAATLGRMILWLPLPIAQVMFPKVVRKENATDSQKRTLRKALGYTCGLVGITLIGAWFAGPLIFNLLFGHVPTVDQIRWLRGIASCMALLGPVYVVLQYELARGRVRRLLPLFALATVYVASALIREVSPDKLIAFLAVAAGLSLLTAARALASETNLFCKDIKDNKDHG